MHFNTSTLTGSALTNLGASFSISQILGLAFDPVSQTVIALDRLTDTVYSVNSTNGNSSVAFTSTGVFQGGAISHSCDGSRSSYRSALHVGHDNVILRVNADGSFGTPVVTAIGLPEVVDDMDFYNGDFLVTAYSSQQIWLVNGTTGASNLFLSSADLLAMGLTGGATGVVADVEAAVPEPSSLVLAGLGLALIFIARFRRSHYGSNGHTRVVE